ncbi:hypothetical protein BDF14DRAFT_1824301 [Spinellus fusiger]|nr:hypothetical protein BDF14DRAFT_1824301 [Spinellus fusiger]
METLDTLKYCPKLRHGQYDMGHQENMDTLEEVQSLRKQVFQLETELAAHQTRHRGDERVTREEFQNLQAYTRHITHELAVAQSERDSLITKYEISGPIETHPILLQQAETIQTLKLEAAEGHIKGPLVHGHSVSLGPTTPREEQFFRLASTSSGRRKVKHVSVVHRPNGGKRKSQSGARSPLEKEYASLTTESLGELIDMLRNNLGEQSFLRQPSQQSSTETPKAWDVTMSGINDHATRWPKAIDETVEPPEEETRLPKDTCVYPSHLLSMPGLVCTEDPLDVEDDLEALAVPAWTDVTKPQSTNGSTKRESLSWTDSVLDDSDNSVTTAPFSGWTASRSREGRRRNKDLIKMLHQTQADILVKQELVGQLEKSEEEYTQMRVNYEEKLNILQEHLQEHLQEMPPFEEPLPRKTIPSRPGSAAQLREERQTQQVRSQYEAKLKRLVNENQDLRRKYTQATSALQTARVKAEGIVARLRSTIEALKAEKKQLQKSMRQDADRARELAIVNDREIQQLKRREVAGVEAKKKLEEANEAQSQMLKKRNEEMALSHTHMRLLVNALRKASGEGILLNEASLDRMMGAVQTRLSRMPARSSFVNAE